MIKVVDYCNSNNCENVSILLIYLQSKIVVVDSIPVALIFDQALQVNDGNSSANFRPQHVTFGRVQ
jgi:hypothetical protein